MNRERWNDDQLGTRRRWSPRPQLFKVRKKNWKKSPFRKSVGPLSIEQRRACKSSCATARHRQRRRVLQSCIRTARAAAELLDTISKFPDRAGEARDPVSAYPQVQMTEAPRWMTLPEEECLEIWTRIPWRQRPKGWDKMIEDPVVSLERNLYGHPWARLLWERKTEDVLLEIVWEEVPIWECLHVHKKLVLLLSIYEDDIKNDLRRNRLSKPSGNLCRKEMTLKFVWDQICLGCMQREAKVNEQAVQSKTERFRRFMTTRGSDGNDLANESNASRKIAAWSHDMSGHAQKCVGIYCQFAKKDVPSLLSVATPSVDDHLIPPEDFEVQGELSDVCAQIVLKCLYLPDIGRPDLILSVGTLAGGPSQSGTKRVTKDCWG